MKSPSELAEAFRAQGLKVTPQRQLLFTLLEGDTTHPTAEGLHARASAQMPGISLRTVYSTLTDLVAMGELQAVCVGSGATRFEPNVAHHHHGVCDNCGAIVDMYVDRAEALGATSDDRFVPNSASIVFHGVCATCVDRDVDVHSQSPNTPIKEHHHG